MGWCDITYCCGHVGRERLGGSNAARNRYVADAAQYRLCPECYRADRSAAGPRVLVRGDGDSVALLAANSYNMRDALKTRGYAFDRWTPPDAPLGIRFTSVGTRPAEIPGWAIRITDPQQLVVELEWIDSQGWPIEVIDPATSGFFQSLGEGRESLLQAMTDRLAGKRTLPTDTIT